METITKTKAEEKQEEKQSHIKGWGIDSDPESEPAYPVKDYSGDDHKRLNYRKPPHQPVTISTPPTGLSGFIRRIAFRYSESGFGHWFPLIFADRINIWEGFLHHFKRGRSHNIFKERGMKSELKYNKKQFLAKTGTSVLIGAFVFAWLLTSSRRKRLKGKR